MAWTFTLKFMWEFNCQHDSKTGPLSPWEFSLPEWMGAFIKRRIIFKIGLFWLQLPHCPLPCRCSLSSTMLVLLLQQEVNENKDGGKWTGISLPIIFIGNYICSLTTVYIYRLVSDNPLFSLFHLYQYPLLLIHLFLRFMALPLFCDPFGLPRAICVTSGLELSTGAWWGHCFTTIKKVLRFIFSLFLHMLMSVYIFHIYVGAPGIQKRVLDPLELELEMVVISLLWVSGIEPQSSGRDTKSSLQFLPFSFWSLIYVFPPFLHPFPSSITREISGFGLTSHRTLLSSGRNDWCRSATCPSTPVS